MRDEHARPWAQDLGAVLVMAAAVHMTQQQYYQQAPGKSRLWTPEAFQWSFGIKPADTNTTLSDNGGV